MLWLLSGPWGFGCWIFFWFRYSVLFTVGSLSLICLLVYLDLYVLGDDALVGWGSFMRAKFLCVFIHILIKGEVGAVKPVRALRWGILLTVPGQCFFCGSFMFLFCLVFVMSLSVYMCFVVTCWERADLLALVCGVYCEFVTFPLVSWVRCGT